MPTDADDVRLAGLSRPGRGPTDAHDALVGALSPRKGPTDACRGPSHPARGQLMLMMPLSGPSRPGRGPTDADDALVGALTPRKRAN